MNDTATDFQASDYRVVIGLEVHVQLKTQTKLFCRCSIRFGQPPNSQVCPVCLGLPGALPVLNAHAIELACRAGAALNCELADLTKWDRKNYFYPDLPKGYQTSQYDLPICSGGYVDIPIAPSVHPTGSQNVYKRIRLVRAHLEEDAGKSMHDEHSGRADSKIDLNRAGTPLLEIVSEPDLSCAEEAKTYLSELRLLMVYLGVSDGNMQEGSLRADANVNLHFVRDGKTVATPIVEVKNLNSFRSVERAIDFEVARQSSEFLRTGLAIGQAPKQTRGWNDALGQTELQRQKEEEADYRYFPCPDLVPIRLTSLQKQTASEQSAATPTHYRDRLIHEHQLKSNDAEILIQQGKPVVEYFLHCIQAGADAKRVSVWMLQDVLRTLNDRSIGIELYPVSPSRMAQLLAAIEQGRVDTSQAKQALAKLIDGPSLSVDAAIESLGIVRVDASEIELLCKELLAENADVIDKVRAGNTKAVAALVGQAKKKNRNADPRLVQETCLKLIEQMQ
ncbi:MAG: Asp-tRNA(Asn)/Glu-tRNA(Gln) amidotransferase subunit GatB [Planctomycetota bacterium]|jgi:aspartyl-tRNA(Asn)/glutamyl-tRNA(Gln) amidotransferase subunit B|nr:Asp-tRNA(Asn)/Glu-tRNA(Gln) amidotransferase subunit GatB [Planctomycetota bacterium]